MTQNKNDLINSILQYDRVVDNNCCTVFPTSRIKRYLSMKISCCLNLHKLQQATSNIAIIEKK